MDLSILKYCPHCDAPMTPTSYNICVGDNQKCTCCDCEPPEDYDFTGIECSVCSKSLNREDFHDKRATYSHEQVFCLDCIHAKRILQKEKEIYNCDFCGEELTPLDFLEDNADIKRMLIVCKSCQDKHFKEDKKKDTGKTEKSKKTEKNNGVSETAQSLMKAVQSAVNDIEKAEELKKTDNSLNSKKDSENENAETSELISEDNNSDIEKKSQPGKSVLKRHKRDNQTSRNFDYRAALGCLVVLVLFLSVGIAYLIYNKYSEQQNKATEDLAFILRAVRDRQNELADGVEMLGNRLYYLEQLEMKRSSERINNNLGNGVKSDDKVEDSPENNSDNADEEDSKAVRVSPKMREILDKLDSEEATEKLNAIMDISWENFRGATPKLLEIIKTEKDKYLRVFAIITLVAFREKDLIPVLKDIIFKEKASIVTETAQQALVELEKFSR